MIVAASLWRGVVGRHSILQCVRRGYRAAWAGLGCLDCVRRAPQMCVRSLSTGRVPLTKHKKQGGGQEEDEARAELNKGSNLLSSLITLIDPSSAPRIYKRAFKKCENHPEVIATFGGPINDYARYPDGNIMQRVSAKKYKRDTVKCMRLTFLISGSKINEATVHVDLKERGPPCAFLSGVCQRAPQAYCPSQSDMPHTQPKGELQTNIFSINNIIYEIVYEKLEYASFSLLVFICNIPVSTGHRWT
ncbi:mitochondrial import inner membrane translocase subunit Tim21 isoform X2 [Lithobates pipiens]